MGQTFQVGTSRQRPWADVICLPERKRRHSDEIRSPTTILSLLESHILPGFRVVGDAILLNGVDTSEAWFLLHFLKEYGQYEDQDGNSGGLVDNVNYCPGQD